MVGTDSIGALSSSLRFFLVSFKFLGRTLPWYLQLMISSMVCGKDLLAVSGRINPSSAATMASIPNIKFGIHGTIFA